MHQSIYRYPRAAIRRGLVVGAGGALAALTLAFAGHENQTVSVICITLSVLFAAYGVRVGLRGISAIILDQTGLRVVGPRQHAVAWDDLADVRVRYFTTRRDGENGWMELSVLGGTNRITIDSDIDGFADLLVHVREMADARGLELTEATSENIDAALAGTFRGGRIETLTGPRRRGNGA